MVPGLPGLAGGLSLMTRRRLLAGPIRGLLLGGLHRPLLDWRHPPHDTGDWRHSYGINFSLKAYKVLSG